MIHIKLMETLKTIRLKKKYIIFAILYGISSLIVPMATQFLVNHLAISGIMVNTLTFSVIVGIALIVAQILKYTQVLLNEFIQREIFVLEARRWYNPERGKAPYFFEIILLMKSFSASFTHLVELALLLFFGLLLIISFHPFFITLLLVLGGCIFFLFFSWEEAVRTSVEESNEKYRLFYKKQDQRSLCEEDLELFLEVRDKHFYFIKRNKILVGTVFVVSQLLLLGSGIYFIQKHQLSIGQLVSAEIILSGILVSLTKLPRTLESLYDFETSKIKIEYALLGGQS